MNIFDIFSKSNFLIQIVILLLLVFSILSWGIIIYQTYIINFIITKIKNFEEKFSHKISLSQFYQDNIKYYFTSQGTERIFYFGFKKFSQLYHSDNYSLKEILQETKKIMKITIYMELEELGKYIIFLSIIGSISPYIGLFGTLLSIIHLFFKLGTIKYCNLETLAPGISESLLFTTLGLFVSIPSIIAFYYFNSCINNIEKKYKIFLYNFLSILQQQIFSKIINKNIKKI